MAKRFIVTATFSVWAESESDALDQAMAWQEEMDRKDDNRPSVMRIEYAPTNSLARPQVYPENHLQKIVNNPSKVGGIIPVKQKQ